jgi:hypothetical protein
VLAFCIEPILFTGIQTVGYRGLGTGPQIGHEHFWVCSLSTMLMFFSSLFQTKALNTPNTNYCQMLQEIAEEQRFEVTYVDIPELSLSGK